MTTSATDQTSRPSASLTGVNMPNIGVQGQIVFVAMRDIAAGEELTHDWATTDDEDYRMECRCGAATCRKIITGKDWQKPELQEKYAGYMSWYLAERIKRQR